jgi:ribosomal protein L34
MIATYQGSKKKARAKGFRIRNRTKLGRDILRRRRAKGRWNLTPKLTRFK